VFGIPFPVDLYSGPNLFPDILVFTHQIGDQVLSVYGPWTYINIFTGTGGILLLLPLVPLFCLIVFHTYQHLLVFFFYLITLTSFFVFLCLSILSSFFLSLCHLYPIFCYLIISPYLLKPLANFSHLSSLFPPILLTFFLHYSGIPTSRLGTEESSTFYYRVSASSPLAWLPPGCHPRRLPFS
jgi:hypothetical protein